MERLFNMIIEALEDPKVSKEDILNWMYSERHIQEVCEDDGDNYELISNELPTHTLGKILMFHETYGK